MEPQITQDAKRRKIITDPEEMMMVKDDPNWVLDETEDTQCLVYIDGGHPGEEPSGEPIVIAMPDNSSSSGPEAEKSETTNESEGQWVFNSQFQSKAGTTVFLVGGQSIRKQRLKKHSQSQSWWWSWSCMPWQSRMLSWKYLQGSFHMWCQAMQNFGFDSVFANDLKLSWAERCPCKTCHDIHLGERL